MANERTPGKRGRRPARPIPELRLERFQTAAPPAPPASADVSAGITAWGMLGNDTHSCCGASAWIHYLMAKAGRTEVSLLGQTYQADDPALTQAMLAVYFAYGRAQGEPGDQPDDGVENATWLQFLIGQGLIEGAAQLDPTNADQVRQAMIDYGGVLVGAALDHNAEQEFASHQPWDVTSTDPIDPNLGHDFLLVQYDPTGGTVVTWGADQRVTLGFGQAEAAAHDLDLWVILSAEDAERTGVDLAALRQEIRNLSGTVVGS